MKVLTHCRSEIGARTKNEDYVAALPKRFGTGAWVVADGVGGSPAGEVAARGAAETLLRVWKKRPRLTVDTVATAFQETNRIMREISLRDSALCGMRTTAAALFYRFGRVVCAHVGDSRVCVFRRGKLFLQTRDHIGQHGELLRALGGQEDYLPELSERFFVRRGDAALLMTDGFWSNISVPQMEEMLNDSRTPQEWVEKLLTLHAGRQNEYQDNYTVLAVFCK